MQNPEAFVSQRLSIATSNPGKIDRVKAVLSEGSFIATQPLFDEDKIKEELRGLGTRDGIQYALLIARRKLAEQRRGFKNSGEQSEDYMLLVSDSVIVVQGENGVTVAVNRDDPDEQKKEVLDIVNAKKLLTFVGSVAFGRLKGNALFSVMTYCDIPLNQNLTSFPVSVDCVRDLKDEDRKFDYGFVSFSGNTPHKQRYGSTSDFDVARPYISGLTPEVLHLAQDNGQFASRFSPVMESKVEEHPFNTMGFYAGLGKEYTRDQVVTFYKGLVNNWQEYFANFGGNCSFFSLDIAERLIVEGFDPKIILYPSTVGDQKDGHSAVIVSDHNGQSYLFDPGLSIPFPMPLTDIPLAPVVVGEGKLVGLGINNLKDKTPELMIVGRSGNTRVVQPSGIISVAEFKDRLPDILTRLHYARLKSGVVKMDFHSADGRQNISFQVKPSNPDRVFVKLMGQDFQSFSFEDLVHQDSPQMETLEKICLSYNINPQKIFDQLKSFMPDQEG